MAELIHCSVCGSAKHDDHRFRAGYGLDLLAMAGCKEDFGDIYDDAPDRPCDHINEREIAGGWLECDDCGRMVPA